MGRPNREHPAEARSGPARSGPARNGPARNGPARNGPARNGLAQSGLARTWGRRQDHPELVVVPGLGILPYLAPLVETMARWTAVTMLDLPGWSLRHRPRCPPDVGAVGAAAADWLVDQDCTGIVLLGHSTGSQAALHAALREPDRLAGLVLASPVFPPTRRPLSGLAGAVARTLPAESWSELPAVLPATVASRVRPMWRLMRSGLATQTEQLAAAARVPVATLTGSADRVAPPAFAELLAARTGGTCRVHPGGHNACFTDPSAVDRAVRNAVAACLGR